MKRIYITPGQRQLGLDLEDTLLVLTSLKTGSNSESDMLLNDTYEDDSDMWGSI